MSPALNAVLWTLYFLLCLQQTESSGVFELQVSSFTNDIGLTANGTCCRGSRHNGICTESCRTYFKVCLAHFQADIGTTAEPRCTFANFTTPVLGDNSMDLGALSKLPVPGARQNVFTFPVREFQWPGDFSLIIEAWHDATQDVPIRPDAQRVLIARLATNRAVSSGPTWNNYTETFNNSTKQLVYGYRFVCEKNYHGATCKVQCRPRNDQFGHFNCDANGTMVCLDGWIGEYCETAICLPGCDTKNGFCSEPNECKCKLGFQGPYCNSCIPYPGCQRGSCDKPWQCNCEEGWGGQFCNQDLNFCTHHKPCRNNGICTNTGQGSYTCRCVGSFAGDNCERELDDCKAKPCMNKGVCKDIGNSFQCECPQGFYGRQCEREALSCKAQPCLSGGSCFEKDETYYCTCPAGLTGRNCEVDINECLSSPCQNGGRCSDQLNGYRCICPTGFSGSECQINDDDCKHRPCHNNGICIDLVNDYKCQCLAGFVGTLCQDNVNDCEMRPCANGGICTDLVNDFQCECKTGFAGKDCSLQVKECKLNPCLNGGICTDMFADYSCLCPAGFWGKNCQLSERVVATSEHTLLRVTNATTVATTTSEKPMTTDAPIGLLPTPSSSQEKENSLSLTEMVIIVCLGGGIPLIIIIIVVTFFLCRKRSFLNQRHTQDNLENLARENNYINKINNKCGDVFSSIPPSASNSSSIKISNEEQEDINKLKAKQFLLSGGEGGCCDGGTSSSVMQISKGKQALEDNLEYPSCSSAVLSSCASKCLDIQTYEQPFRRLNVESLQIDTSNRGHHPEHSQGIHVLVKSSGLRSSNSEQVIKDSPPLKGYNSSPITITQQQQQPAYLRHMRYDEDYLATEV